MGTCTSCTKTYMYFTAHCTSTHLANSTKKVYYKSIESESFRAKSEEEEYQSALPNP